MATGGSLPPDCDHAECSVCLESMITKDPRLLTCGHSFCTPCIQNLAANDPITCPICREETKLPTGGVGELQMFDKESAGHCGLCLRHNKHITATHTCDKCPNKMICGSCADMHSVYPVLLSHQIKIIEVKDAGPVISKVCKVHSRHLEYFCPECQVKLCLDCIYINEHKGHEDRITDIDQGASELKCAIVGINKELKTKTKQLDRNIRDFETELNNMHASECEMISLRNKLEEQMRITEESIQTIKDHQEELRSKISKMHLLKKESSGLQREFMNLETISGHEYINKGMKYIDKTNKIMKDLDKPIVGVTTVKYAPNLSGNASYLEIKFQLSKEFSTEELSLKKPELVCKLKPGGTVLFHTPREILAVGDGTVIFVNEGLTDLQRLDIKGNITQVYKMGKVIQSAAVEQDILFVASSDKTITMLALDESIPRVTYKPDVNINRITAAGMNVIISHYSSNGSIYECNKDYNNTRVSGLNYPLFVNTANVKGEQHFIITELGNKKIHIYTGDWKLLHSTDTKGGSPFKSPNGNAITPGGKVLIADSGDHTVSEFKLDGTYVRDILTNPAINQPSGILYDYPYLWVSEKTPALKVFRVD